MVSSTTVLGLTTVIGNDPVDVPTHFSVGGHQKLEDLLTGGLAPAGSIALAFGTITADRGLRLTSTWNNAGVTFKGWSLVVTDTASAADSLLADLKVGSTTMFSVSKAGVLVAGGGATLGAAPLTIGAPAASAGAIRLVYGDAIGWRNLAGTGDVLLSVETLGSVETMRIMFGGLGRLFLTTNGLLGIGTSTNSTMSQGITIHQGVFDNEILAFKSSDVNHGMTDYADTDTFAAFRKAVADEGGLSVRGFNDTGVRGLVLDGLATSDDATKAAGATAPVIIQATKKLGTAGTAPAANSNLIAFYVAAVGARFILDVDGDSHQDVGTAWTTFDGEDDTALLNTLADAVARPDDPIRDDFRHWLTYNRTDLERARLVTFNDDGRHFVNMSKLTMLLVGTVRQQGEKIRLLTERVALLPPSVGAV